jgi:CubicO group peptidase (beta-lactamase class C family)
MQSATPQPGPPCILQPGEGISENYGLGWATGGGAIGHGGAYSTHMGIDVQRGLIPVFMVQHAGYPGPDGGKIHPAFIKAAREAFRPSQ